MKKKIIRIVSFLLIVAFFGNIFSLILRKYWSFETDAAATNIAQGFYEVEEDTLDVIFLGSSSVRNAASPLYMWNRYGITGYVRGSAQQSLLCSYYLLKESLSCQKNVKVVVMEGSSLRYNEGNDFEDLDVQEPRLHEVTDNMRMGMDKLELIRDVVDNSEKISFLDMLSPLYRYHDRWSELEQDDFLYSLEAEPYPFKGQYPAYTTSSLNYVDYMQEDDHEHDPYSEVNPDALVYFERMVELCEEKGVKMVLIRVPTISWTYEKSQSLATLASNFGIPFLDYNLPELRDAVEINIKTDFADGSAHLNIYGANKMSEHLGKFLVENYQLSDKRGLSDYNSWDEDYQYYLELQQAVEVAKESNLVEYLKKINNPNYIVAIAGKYDLAKKFNSDILSAMQALGLRQNLEDYPYTSYIALIDGGKVIAEELDKEVLSRFYDIDGLDILITSGGKNIPDMHGSILVDGSEESRDAVGFNILVYDKLAERVISSRNFNTSKTGVDYFERD